MILFSQLIAIFSIMLLGLFCYKRRIFDNSQIHGFELLLFKIIMPSYLFATVYKNDLSDLWNTRYITAYLLIFAILSLMVTVLFAKRLPIIAICIRILGASYVNAAIYAVPVITILFKDPTAAVIGNIIQVIVIQPIFVILLNILKHREKSLIRKIVDSIATPLIIMPMMGILLNYLEIAVPMPIIDAISQIGNGASGLALFAFGLMLGATKITLQCLRFDLLSIVFIKSIVHPFVAIGVACFMKLEGYWLNSLVIIASAPTAFVVYLISKQFSAEEELIKKVVALSAVIATISLIFITIAIQ